MIAIGWGGSKIWSGRRGGSPASGAGQTADVIGLKLAGTARAARTGSCVSSGDETQHAIRAEAGGETVGEVGDLILLDGAAIEAGLDRGLWLRSPEATGG